MLLCNILLPKSPFFVLSNWTTGCTSISCSHAPSLRPWFQFKFFCSFMSYFNKYLLPPWTRNFGCLTCKNQLSNAKRLANWVQIGVQEYLVHWNIKLSLFEIQSDCRLWFCVGVLHVDLVIWLPAAFKGWTLVPEVGDLDQPRLGYGSTSYPWIISRNYSEKVN